MKLKTCGMWIFVFFLSFGIATAQEWMQVPGVIHVHTDFDGAGQYSLEQLVSKAKEKNSIATRCFLL